MTSESPRSGDARQLLRVDARDPQAVNVALERALTGAGPAVLPTTGPLPLSGSLTGAQPPDAERLGPVPGDVVLVIETSGSTAEPKRVMLTADALRASAAATYQRFDQLFGGAGDAGGQGGGAPDGRAALGRDAPLDGGVASQGGGDGVPWAGLSTVPSRQWLLTLPASYVAGAQVLMRSILAGTEPVVLRDEHFTAEGFASAAAELTADRRYVSLVPAQLARLLNAAEGEETHSAAADADADADAGADAPSVAAAVARFDAILVGGQSLPPALRSRARALGWNLVTSYGSSETSGGSLYNGEPLDGVMVRIRDGEVQLAGQVLAAGYLGDAKRTSEAFIVDGGERWYRTSDGGRLERDASTGRERLVVTGRLDNVIVSGGEKVLLDRVEGIVRQLPGLDGAVVVAAPSAEWGQVPALVVEAGVWHASTGTPFVKKAETNSADAGKADAYADEQAAPAAVLVESRELSTDERWLAVRDAAAGAGRAARPALLLLVTSIPNLPSGKPDRRSLEQLVAELSVAL